MAGFDWENQRGVDGTVFVRALRSLGTVNLPKILPHIEGGIADQLGCYLDEHRCDHGMDVIIGCEEKEADDDSIPVHSNLWYGKKYHNASGLQYVLWA